MTSRDYIKKWLFYALALLPIWILDSAVLSRYPVFGIRPTLLPLAVTAVATLEGSLGGAGFGLGVGLLWAATYSDVPGIAVIALTVAGFAVGTLTQYALSQTFFGCLLCSGGAFFIAGGLRSLYFLFLRIATADVILPLALGEILLSIAWLPLVYFLFYLVFRRVGGMRLAVGH